MKDKRTAELIASGPNAGDWDFYPASEAPDAVDQWVKQRDQYFASRKNRDPKYFDEYVFGAEDLDDYGDWVNTNDYGWVWRPNASSLSVYTDWAPYRYGHWTWCPPYGWTWVGYESWGWAPDHYGRWGYYHGYWAWCPRSHFYRQRSWWRPALVAFVFDVSFGNNICWYPLNYYQQDPHSRHYRHGNNGYQHPGYGNNRPGRPADPGASEYKHSRGVTRVPRVDFGNPNRRGEAADEAIARRVLEREPDRENLPGRTFSDGRPGRQLPVIDVADRPTGPGDRGTGGTV